MERPSFQNGGQARRLSSSRFHASAATLERKYSAGSGNGNYDRDLDDDFNDHSDDHQNGGTTNGNGHHHNHNDVDDDDDVDSSLGYIDTRTPYISRIIQAKSSKSYSAGLKK